MAVKLPPAAARAVTEVRPAGTGSADSAQLAPPLAELAANGTGRPAVVTAVPTATTTRPALATCSQHGPGGADRQGQVGLPPGPAAVRRGPGRRLVAVRAHRDESGPAGGDGRHLPVTGPVERARGGVPGTLPAGQGGRPPDRGFGADRDDPAVLDLLDVLVADDDVAPGVRGRLLGEQPGRAEDALAVGRLPAGAVGGDDDDRVLGGGRRDVAHRQPAHRAVGHAGQPLRPGPAEHGREGADGPGP